MEYQARYLLPSRKRLKAFARVLKPLALEKWVLVFYQHETYPFRQFFDEVDESSDPFGDLKKKVPENFVLADDVEPAFLAANATFHVLLLPTTTKNKFYSRFLRLEEIHSDWEEAFRRIGRATGGEVLEAELFDEELPSRLWKRRCLLRTQLCTLMRAPEKDGLSP